jgi:HAMP domain-containing protein
MFRSLLAGDYYILRAQLLRPLATLNQAAQRMAHGDLIHSVPVERRDELGAVAIAFETMRAEIATAHDELETRVDHRTQEMTSAFEFSQEITRNPRKNIWHSRYALFTALRAPSRKADAVGAGLAIVMGLTPWHLMRGRHAHALLQALFHHAKGYLAG